MAAVEEERVMRSASLGWRQHCETCDPAGLELGECIRDKECVKLFAAQIANTVLLANEFKQRGPLCKSRHADSIAKQVTPESAPSGQNHRVFATFLQFRGQPAFFRILIEELKKMRGHGGDGGLVLLDRNGDDSLGGQQPLALNRYSWKSM